MSTETSPSRRLHITRLPSSALLSSQLRDQLVNRHVRIVSLSLNRDLPQSDFLFSFTQAEPIDRDPSLIQWDLYQALGDAETLFLVARNLFPPASSLSPAVRLSGMFDCDTKLDSKISSWLARTKSYLSKPHSSVRLSIIASCQEDPHNAGSPASDLKSPSAASSSSHSHSLNSEALTLLEVLKVRSQQDTEFAKSCTQWLTQDEPGTSPSTRTTTAATGTACTESSAGTNSPTAKVTDRVDPSERLSHLPGGYLASTVSAETGLTMQYMVMRDLDSPEAFRILYFFRNAEECARIRESSSWRKWRAEVSRYLLGPAAVFELRRLLYSGQTGRSRDHARIVPTRRLPSRLVHHDTPLHGESDASKDVAERAVQADEKLGKYKAFIRARFEAYQRLSAEIKNQGTEKSGSSGSLTQESVAASAGATEALINFANGASEFGLVCIGTDEYRVREYLPGARSVYVMGDFNAWNRSSHKLEAQLDDAGGRTGVFSLIVKSATLRHHQRYKLIVEGPGESEASEKPCPFSKLAWKSEMGPTYDSVVYQPAEPFIFQHPHPRSVPGLSLDTLRAYEVNVGLCSEACVVGTYVDCIEQVLPRAAAMKANTVILSGVLQHSYLPSGGWHVTSYFAPCSQFGSPEELKKLIDRAHGLGLRVVISLVVSHAGPSECDGLGKLDNTDTSGGLFREEREVNWDGLIFDYTSFGRKFMLSVIRYWMEEFRVDGFRLEGLSSLLYKDHALNGGFDRFDYDTFFQGCNADLENQAFLILANDLIKLLNPDAISIASDVTETPTLGLPVSQGGLGFDYVMSHHSTQAFSQMIDNLDAPSYSLNALRFQLDRQSLEKRIAAIETLDTMVIGKRPMKIAFFAWETLHTIAVGGIAPHVTELAAALRRCGHEVHVFTRAVGVQSDVSVHYGVHYHQVTFDLNRDFIAECQNMCNAFVDHLLGWERSTGDSFTIVHGHDWLVGRAICAMKGLGRTCVFTMHSTEAGRCGNQVFGGESARIRHIEREACLVADRVICVSGVLAEEVKSLYGIAGEKIRVVYNGCNVQNFDGFEEAAPIKERYGINAMDPTILFVGRFVVQKGVDLLIEAMPNIMRFRGDVRFVIVGDGHMRAECERRANELGVGHACRFVGAKGGAELKSLFKMCDAVIVPSRNEPFGIVVLEAWSAFKPVIATTSGGPRDFVSPGVDGILVDPNPNSISWGVCELLKNFEHARWMGERGRVKAAFSFSWDTIGRQTRDIYFELINKSDAAYCLDFRGDCSLAQRALGEAVYYHMGIFDDNEHTRRGLSLLRLAQLLCVTLAGEAQLTAFGSEFAHPDWIDFPRAGNNFSHMYARRQWSLGQRKDLKYKHMWHFSAVLTELDILLGLLTAKHLYVNKCSEEDRVLTFERGECLVVANLSADRSYDGFGVGHNLGGCGTLRHILDTDETRFGGYGRLETRFMEYPPCEESVDERFTKAVKVYLPSRTALVLCTAERFEAADLANNKRLAEETPDQFIDSFITEYPYLA